MGQERGLFRLIFKAFLNSITPKLSKRIFAGEDYYGTKYYEVARSANSTFSRPSRFFEPVNKDNFEQNIPAEWEAWLRYRRDKPPTEEEVNRNYQMIIQTQKNAADIEALYTKNETNGTLNSIKPLTEHTSMSFPIYEEYKNFGQDYKKKKDTKK